jgi:hypothetical protein
MSVNKFVHGMSKALNPTDLGKFVDLFRMPPTQEKKMQHLPLSRIN